MGGDIIISSLPFEDEVLDCLIEWQDVHQEATEAKNENSKLTLEQFVCLGNLLKELLLDYQDLHEVVLGLVCYFVLKCLNLRSLNSISQVEDVEFDFEEEASKILNSAVLAASVLDHSLFGAILPSNGLYMFITTEIYLICIISIFCISR